MYVTGNVFGSDGELGAEPFKRDPELEPTENYKELELLNLYRAGRSRLNTLKTCPRSLCFLEGASAGASKKKS